MDRSRRRPRIGLGIGLLQLVIMPMFAPAQTPRDGAATTPSRTRIEDEIRRSSVSWERRPGPERQVIDVVCLVPDLPTFLETIAAWDEAHAFPILIDDVELTFKFLRAFRPGRIVRSPRRSEPIPAGKLWDE